MKIKNNNTRFFLSEKRRSNTLPMARIQPFCREINNNSGFLDRRGIIPRLVTDRNKAL